jgi:hydrophobic/amphiphilic exporter-1 (mainly G- bacteria), HAE1 family
LAPPFSGQQKYSTLFLSNYLDVYVKDSLKRIPGVADVIIFGERKYSMRLWLDPVRMAGRALTAPDVVKRFPSRTWKLPPDKWASSPRWPGQQYQISVRAVGRLSEASQFDNIILKTNADGTLVRLKDVGHAELGAEITANDVQFNGQDAIGIGVTQLSTANALDVDRKCDRGTRPAVEKLPSGHALQNRVRYHRRSGRVDPRRGLHGRLGDRLVILVIFIFLGDWRTTMIHFIATPVSLIGTFIFVKLLGFSINTLTLFGITLATGLVVDDAIVVIENIERHMAEGEHDSHKAAAAATGRDYQRRHRHLAGAGAVFVPVAFFPGTTGILFRQFALTIAFSIAISAFNALTLAPVLAAIFLSGGTGKKWWWLQKFDDGVAVVTRGYRSLLHYVLNTSWP